MNSETTRVCLYFLVFEALSMKNSLNSQQLIVMNQVRIINQQHEYDNALIQFVIKQGIELHLVLC